MSDKDRKIIQELRDDAYFKLCRLYIPLFLALAYVYYTMQPGMSFRGKPLKYGGMTFIDYVHVFEIFALVFGSVFFIFLVRDYRRLLRPLFRELTSNKKYTQNFPARKYDDPIFGKHLIFYPNKADYYIELTPEDFNTVRDGQSLYMETGSVTGEIFLLKSEERLFSSASEYCFTDY